MPVGKPIWIESQGHRIGRDADGAEVAQRGLGFVLRARVLEEADKAVKALDGLEVVVVVELDGFGDGQDTIFTDYGYSFCGLRNVDESGAAEDKAEVAEVGEMEEKGEWIGCSGAGPVIAAGLQVLDAVELELDSVNPAQHGSRRQGSDVGSTYSLPG